MAKNENKNAVYICVVDHMYFSKLKVTRYEKEWLLQIGKMMILIRY